MRIFSIITALLVSASLYLLVFERPAVLVFAASEKPDDPVAEAEAPVDTTPRVAVVAMASRAVPIEQLVRVRGRTEAARQVDVRAETGGAVVSEPLRKGTFVAEGELLCRIDPGTRAVSLDEARARLAEARSRLPEAEARLAEARAGLPAADARAQESGARVPEARARVAEAAANVPAAQARLAEAVAGIPTAEARLAEAKAGISTAEARLAEARAAIPAAEGGLLEAKSKLPEAEARVEEARARLNEAQINLNAATKLAKGGFASDTRVAAAQAAEQTALTGVQAALSQLEGAKAGVQSAMSRVEGARAGEQAALGQVESAYAAVQSAKGQVEGSKAAVEIAKSQVESARASVQSAKSGVEGAAAGIVTASSQIESAKAGVQSALSGVEAAAAGIQSAEAAVAAAEKEIERLQVMAPFAGLLETDTAELGSLLQPGSLCATIVQLDPIKLVGFVPETEVEKVSVGAPAGARLATGREVTGKVTFLSRSADPETRTFRVEVQVPNADMAIRDGQTVEIGVQAAGRQAHLVPQSALTLDDEGKLGVRIVDAERRAGFVEVAVLRDTKQGMYVSGLPDNADIIVVGQELVTDGVPIEPTFREAVQ